METQLFKRTFWASFADTHWGLRRFLTGTQHERLAGWKVTFTYWDFPGYCGLSRV